MTPNDALNLFGVTYANLATELKPAYHRLAKKRHPDVGGDEEAFKELNEAYQILQEVQAQQDVFRDSFRNFGRMRVGLPVYPTDEELIIANLCVSIADIKRGRVIDLAYKKSIPCETCQHSGKTDDCQNCSGTGYKTVDERISVELTGKGQHVSVS